MSRHTFTEVERYVVFTVHGETCYICKKLVNLNTMEVDHVIPESLKECPSRLAAALADLGRRSDFDLNSYANWMPSCRRCNNLKRDAVFEPTLEVQLILQRAADKATKAQKIAEKAVSDRQISQAINLLARVGESGALQPWMVKALLPFFAFHIEHRDSELAAEPIRLTRNIALAPYSLNYLFHDMETGRLVVPEFHHGYSWRREEAKGLFASVNHGLLIGTFTVVEQASDFFIAAPSEKTLFPKPSEQTAKLERNHWLIDGVQRLATLYNGLFATSDSFELLYHLTRREFFFSEESEKNEPLIRMSTLFNTEELVTLQATFAKQEDGRTLLAELNKVRDRFYSYIVPTCILKDLQKSEIVEVYTCMNTAGRPLKKRGAR
jgi:hypothetical protein